MSALRQMRTEKNARAEGYREVFGPLGAVTRTKRGSHEQNPEKSASSRDSSCDLTSGNHQYLRTFFSISHYHTMASNHIRSDRCCATAESFGDFTFRKAEEVLGPSSVGAEEEEDHRSVGVAWASVSFPNPAGWHIVRVHKTTCET
jgi:hypothetical protein